MRLNQYRLAALAAVFLTLSVTAPAPAKAQIFNNPFVKPFLESCWKAVCETADGYYLEYCAPSQPMYIPPAPVMPTPVQPEHPKYPPPLCSNIPICPDGIGGDDDRYDWDNEGCIPPLPKAGGKP